MSNGGRREGNSNPSNSTAFRTPTRGCATPGSHKTLLEGSGFEPSVPGDKLWQMVRVLQAPAGRATPTYGAAGMSGSALS
jgi:hypothetical protein